MVRDPFADEDPDLESVLDALDDRNARTIVTELDEPMTASELSDACDIPLSTTYRKLELLTEASILEEQTVVRSDGHHTTRYAVSFEAVHVELDERREFAVTISRPPQTADERLARIWSEVQKET